MDDKTLSEHMADLVSAWDEFERVVKEAYGA